MVREIKEIYGGEATAIAGNTRSQESLEKLVAETVKVGTRLYIYIYIYIYIKSIQNDAVFVF